jgi:Cu2+-containing amine oxidase
MRAAVVAGVVLICVAAQRQSQPQRLINLSSSRAWKIVNPSEANAPGQSVGYTLVAGENSLPTLGLILGYET